MSGTIGKIIQFHAHAVKGGLIMPETKTIILCAIVILLGIVVSALLVDKAITLSEQHELEINASWEDGWQDGWGFGYNASVVDMFNTAYRLDFVEILIDGNNTAKLYSPQGCINAIQQVQEGG